MCGHYTQVVWASSIHIGCAYHWCQPLTGAFSQATLLVCNYAPAGNLVGAQPFTKVCLRLAVYKMLMSRTPGDRFTKINILRRSYEYLTIMHM